VFCSDPVPISLRQMVAGTGLSKTAAVFVEAVFRRYALRRCKAVTKMSAVQDATAAGILGHERHRKGTFGTLSSQYAINWQATVERTP
jgi:hypothetical protein